MPFRYFRNSALSTRPLHGPHSNLRISGHLTGPLVHKGRTNISFFGGELVGSLLAVVDGGPGHVLLGTVRRIVSWTITELL